MAFCWELKKTLFNKFCLLNGYFCISSKFLKQLSSPPRNKQTNKQTNKQENQRTNETLKQEDCVLFLTKQG